MENKQSETILNLARSFAGESQARTRYTIYADTTQQFALCDLTVSDLHERIVV